jgi:hypothetical protein
MKCINSTGASLVHVPGWVGGWVDGWMGVKAVLRIAYINQKLITIESYLKWLKYPVRKAF